MQLQVLNDDRINILQRQLFSDRKYPLFLRKILNLGFTLNATKLEKMRVLRDYHFELQIIRCFRLVTNSRFRPRICIFLYIAVTKMVNHYLRLIYIFVCCCQSHCSCTAVKLSPCN